LTWSVILFDVSRFARYVNASNLSRIERGTQGYSPETLERIATALGVTVSELHRRVLGRSITNGISSWWPETPCTETPRCKRAPATASSSRPTIWMNRSSLVFGNQLGSA